MFLKRDDWANSHIQPSNILIYLTSITLLITLYIYTFDLLWCEIRSLSTDIETHIGDILLFVTNLINILFSHLINYLYTNSYTLFECLFWFINVPWFKTVYGAISKLTVVQLQNSLWCNFKTHWGATSKLTGVQLQNWMWCDLKLCVQNHQLKGISDLKTPP